MASEDAFKAHRCATISIVRHSQYFADLSRLEANCQGCPPLQAPHKAQWPEHGVSQQVAQHHLHIKTGT